jgi:hypothetical protein
VEQAIGLVLEIFGPAALVAFVTALCLTWLGQRFLRAELAGRFVLPCAAAAAFFAGYLALPRSFAALVPQLGRAWIWLPYLGLVAAAGGIAPPKFGRKVSGFTAVLVMSLAGAALSPTWRVYGFSRFPLAGFLVFYLLAVGLALFGLPRITGGGRSGLFLAAVCVLNAVVIGAVCSVRLAQLAALVAASITGISIALFSGSKVCEFALRRFAPLFAVLTGGISWLACVEPDPPQPMLLAIPLLTWLLWVPQAAAKVPSAGDGIS